MKEASYNRRAMVHLLRAIVGLLFAASVVICCEPPDVRTQREDTQAKDWINPPPSAAATREMAKSQWAPVNVENRARAATLLEESSWTPLTDEVANSYINTQHDPKQNMKAYLIRGIGVANGEPPRAVRLIGHSVLVAGGALGDCTPGRTRHPVVVWLPFPPNTVFATFSPAK